MSEIDERCATCNFSYESISRKADYRGMGPSENVLKCRRFPPTQEEKIVCHGVDLSSTPIYESVGGDPVVSHSHKCGEYKAKQP